MLLTRIRSSEYRSQIRCRYACQQQTAAGHERRLVVLNSTNMKIILY